MVLSNQIYKGAGGKESLIDLEIPESFNGEIVIFIHGFMGFKNWGAWHLVQEYFVKHHFGFCKLNTSHNGGTINNGIDFPDAYAFKNNTYSKEIEDLKCAVKWIDLNISNWKGHVIGHSKGGAVALIAGAQINQISSVSTWASIASISERFPRDADLNEWRENGIRIIKNGRTKQNLPQGFDLYEDFKRNEKEYDLERLCRNYNKPVFIAHGINDTSVSIDNGKRLAQWLQQKLHVIANADHVFQSKHPWISSDLPVQLKELSEKTLNFLKTIEENK